MAFLGFSGGHQQLLPSGTVLYRVVATSKIVTVSCEEIPGAALSYSTEGRICDCKLFPRFFSGVISCPLVTVESLGQVSNL